MNLPDAIDRLDELALDAENENYHSLAGVIWNDAIPSLKARVAESDAAVTLFIVTEDGLEVVEVQP